MVGIGHNSAKTVNGLNGQELLKIILSYESLQSQKDEIGEEQKGLIQEAKSKGFDAKMVRKLIAERKKDPEKIAEEQNLLELYRDAIGMGFLNETDGAE